MPWDLKYSNFGIAIIDGKNVKVFSGADNYFTIGLGEEIADALWVGDELNVTLKNGEVRRYNDKYNYTTI
ncbi:hypothetical protein D4R20_01350 [bacterium]|nr:MAG: hypothetical protein D4R20_01350 [bacterium]